MEQISGFSSNKSILRNFIKLCRRRARFRQAPARSAKAQAVAARVGTRSAMAAA
jgi:hypothetical protein